MFKTKMKAKDIMTTEVVSVKKDTAIYEAVKLMRNNEITGMPVVEDDMTLVGVLTEKDVLRLFYADEDEKHGDVSTFMTRPAIHYKESDTLQSVCDFMMINYFRRVPVTSKSGKLVGIISRPDVIDYILQMKGESLRSD
ncbi:MAG: CBS domain-containing protein [Planctomycetota bacterium]